MLAPDIPKCTVIVEVKTMDPPFGIQGNTRWSLLGVNPTTLNSRIKSLGIKQT